jgi:hypothetical protein
MELFVLGLVFGAATAQGKAVTKAVAKGYMAVSEKTREVVSTLREDMRGAIDEARVERDQDEAEPEATGHDAEALALQEETAPTVTIASATTVPPAATPSSTAQPKQTPAVMKSLAKRYMVMTEKTREAVSGIRENVRDAIEEARYERELAAQRAAQQAESDAAIKINVEANNEEAKQEPAVEPVVEAAPRQKRAYTPRSTRTTADAVKTVTDTPKPARSKRTKTSAVKAAAVAPAPAAPVAAPAKRGRPRKTSAAPTSNAHDALLEVAEIAADAL